MADATPMWKQVPGKPYFTNDAGQFYLPQIMGGADSQPTPFGLGSGQEGTLGTPTGELTAAPQGFDFWTAQGRSAPDTGFAPGGAGGATGPGMPTGQGWISTSPFGTEQFSNKDQGLLSQLQGLAIPGLALGAGALAGALGGAAAGGGADLGGIFAAQNIPILAASNPFDLAALTAEAGGAAAGAAGGGDIGGIFSPQNIPSLQAGGASSGFDLSNLTSSVLGGATDIAGGLEAGAGGTGGITADSIAAGITGGENAPGAFSGLNEALMTSGAAAPAAPFSFPGQGAYPIQFSPADSSGFAEGFSGFDASGAATTVDPTLGSASILDQIPNLPPGLQKFLKDNWKTIAGGGLAAATALKPQPKIPNIGDITGIAESLKGAGAASTAGAQQLMQPLQTGVLPAGQQATLDQAKESAKTSIRGKYANLGLSGSTMEQQELNNVDLQGTSLAGQMEQQLFTSGLQEAGVAGTDQVNAANLYKELSALTLSEDQQLRDALSRFAGSLAMGGAVGAASK